MHCSKQESWNAENMLNIFAEISQKLLIFCSKTFLDVYLLAPEGKSYKKLFRSQQSKFHYSKL